MPRSTFPSLFITTFAFMVCILPSLSEHAVRQHDYYFPVQTEPKPLPVPVHGRKVGMKPISSLTRLGFTGDSCRNTSECVSPRQCRAGGVECSGNSSDCKCRTTSDLSCATSFNCDRNSRCIDYPNVGTGECFACNRTVDQLPENADAIDDGNCVCIASDLLNTLNVSALVFKSHRIAHVLCDHLENCATPGHFVIFNNIPMSMATYCTQHNITCRPDVKLVNNPKMKLGLRIPSHSNYLKFTPFAAAKQTLVEEIALRIIVALGL